MFCNNRLPTDSKIFPIKLNLVKKVKFSCESFSPDLNVS